MFGTKNTRVFSAFILCCVLDFSSCFFLSLNSSRPQFRGSYCLDRHFLHNDAIDPVVYQAESYHRGTCSAGNSGSYRTQYEGSLSKDLHFYVSGDDKDK